jgi:hypothetical protein
MSILSPANDINSWVQCMSPRVVWFQKYPVCPPPRLTFKSIIQEPKKLQMGRAFRLLSDARGSSKIEGGLVGLVDLSSAPFLQRPQS